MAVRRFFIPLFVGSLKRTSIIRKIASVACVLLLTIVYSGARADDDQGGWRQSVFLYGMAASIEGDARIGPVSVSVDQGISDFFDALWFGAMAAYRIENDTWSFVGHLTYMSLRSEETFQQGAASVVLDTEQLTALFQQVAISLGISKPGSRSPIST